MGKILSVIGGTAAVILGIMGIIKWWGTFISALKVGIPLLLLFGGAIALFIGITEIKDTLTRSEEPEVSTCEEPEESAPKGKKK